MKKNSQNEVSRNDINYFISDVKKLIILTLKKAYLF